MNEKASAPPVLQTDTPTLLTFGQMAEWIIWQFPRSKGERWYAAVYSPFAPGKWMPALLHPKEKTAELYAHIPQTFSTPEAAADWLINFQEGEPSSK